jgi:radical SAM superfamily enzyme YgiQ (UPF0313 family)
MGQKVGFIWSQEPFLPQGLFKHFVYLGETAQYTRGLSNVEILDLSVRPEKRGKLVQMSRECDYLLIPVEAYTVKSARLLSNLIKENGSAKRVAYGTIASVNPEVLSQHFDIILSKGNWEQAIKKMLLDYNSFNEELNGGIHTNSIPIDNSEWTHPPLDLLPMREYLRIHPDQLEIRVQRGCVHNCSFCGEKYRVPERKVYHRNPKDTLQFVKQNPNFFYYLDATTFTQDLEWAIETSKIMGSAKVKWRTVTRADKITQRVAKEMGKNGCIKIGFGIETLSKSLQIKTNKIVELETIRQASAYLKEAGIIPRGFLIMGLPEQNGDDVRETQKKVEELGIEYRWKEYIPFDEISKIKEINDFERYERNRFPKHQVSGLSNEEYTKLLSIER